MTYQDAYEQSAKLGQQLKALMAEMNNLSWKYAQPGCQTEERKARIDAMAAEYRSIEAQRRQIWEGVAA